MPADHDTILQAWRENAARDEARNYRFLRSLKMVSDPERIDALARDLHGNAFDRIDCTRCANCCKTMPTFIEAHLVRDPEEGDYVVKVTPCTFLGADDRCTIYDVRPEACRGFPHTDKEHFASRAQEHAANTRNCPAVYFVVTRLRRRLRSR